MKIIRQFFEMTNELTIKFELILRKVNRNLNFENHRETGAVLIAQIVKEAENKNNNEAQEYISTYILHEKVC